MMEHELVSNPNDFIVVMACMVVPLTSVTMLLAGLACQWGQVQGYRLRWGERGGRVSRRKSRHGARDECNKAAGWLGRPINPKSHSFGAPNEMGRRRAPVVAGIPLLGMISGGKSEQTQESQPEHAG